MSNRSIAGLLTFQKHNPMKSVFDLVSYLLNDICILLNEIFVSLCIRSYQYLNHLAVDLKVMVN